MARKRKRKYKRRRKTSKSINLGHGFKLNISSSGVNVSGGIKGARISVGNKGVKSTLSVPGTGIRKTKTLVSAKDIFDGKDDKKDDKKQDSKERAAKERELKEARAKEKDRKEEERLEAIAKEDNVEARLDALNDNDAPMHSERRHAPFKQEEVKKKLLEKLPNRLPIFIGIGLVGILILFFSKVFAALLIVLACALILPIFITSKGKSKALYNEGVDLYNNDVLDGALYKFNQAISLVPEDELYNKTLYKILFYEQEDFEAAKKPLTILVKQHRSKKAKVALAKCYLMTNEAKKVIELLEPLLDDYQFKAKKLIEVQYILGYAYLDELEFEASKKLLFEVAKVDENYEDVKRLLGQLS